jgi:seryl-tRNA synthetase
VRGIKRLHQFDKLEMDVVCRPERSGEILDYLVGINEWFLQSLQLPYRIWFKCSGDMGYYASYEQYDFEVWLPASGEYIEEGSATNAGDYQAHRMKIKFIDQSKNNEIRLCHTVNDTGVAAGRMILAILENYQQANGSVKVPEVLWKYTGFKEIRPKNV